MTDSPEYEHGAPNSRRVFVDRGVVCYSSDGRPREVWTRYGHKRPNPWLNAPLPNVTYYVGANQEQRRKRLKLLHIFRTEYDGSTSVAEVLNLRMFVGADKGKRWSKKQASPKGFPGGDFDRGHLIAAEFGAGMEAINLVSMPASVNRLHRTETARAQGFGAIADLGERYRNHHNYFKGSLTFRGEFILPNYRLFEQVVQSQAQDGIKERYEVSLRVKPATVNGVTDVLHAELWLDDNLVRYVLDNDLER